MSKAFIVKRLKVIDNIIGSIVKVLCILLLIIIVCTIAISITTRFVFFNPLNFADALAKYLMIWMCFLGSGLAIRSNEHIIVDIFSSKLKNKGKKRLLIFSYIIVSFFFIMVIYNGFRFALSGVSSHDPFVFGISMVIPYLSVPIGFLYMFIQLNITTFISFLTTEEI